MRIDPVFSLRETVYLKSDPDQFERIVLAYHVTPFGLMYILACGEAESLHYDFEISLDKQIQL